MCPPTQLCPKEKIPRSISVSSKVGNKWDKGKWKGEIKIVLIIMK